MEHRRRNIHDLGVRKGEALSDRPTTKHQNAIEPVRSSEFDAACQRSGRPLDVWRSFLSRHALLEEESVLPPRRQDVRRPICMRTVVNLIRPVTVAYKSFAS